MPSAHSIYDFVSYYGNSYMNYLDVETCSKLNNYIQSEVDVSNWYPCDIIEVHLTHDCSEKAEIFIWDGYKVVYPFHNGDCNDYNIVREKIDNVIHSDGFMPNVFQAFYDYDPNSIFYNEDINFPSKVGFANLVNWYSEIKDNTVSIDSESCYGNTQINICSFGDNKHMIFIGDFDGEIDDYISNNRPYDFNIDNLVYGYNLSVGFEDIVSACDGEEGDYYFFIHPRHIGLDYNLHSTHEECVPVYSQSKFFGSTEKKSKSRKSDNKKRRRTRG